MPARLLPRIGLRHAGTKEGFLVVAVAVGVVVLGCSRGEFGAAVVGLRSGEFGVAGLVKGEVGRDIGFLSAVVVVVVMSGYGSDSAVREVVCSCGTRLRGFEWRFVVIVDSR